MFTRGKLPLVGEKVHGVAEVRHLFDACAEHEEGQP
jgi:hypothetical protein